MFVKKGFFIEFIKCCEWRSMIFFFKKLSLIKRRYITHDQEMLTIVEFFKIWWHYFQNCKYSVQVFINHAHLHYFLTTKSLIEHQIRWVKLLSKYNFIILYCSDWLNLTDASLKQFNYDIIDENKDSTKKSLSSLQKKLAAED